MKSVCVVGTVEYGDFVMSKEILEKFHLKVYYKNIPDINKYFFGSDFPTVFSACNNYIQKIVDKTTRSRIDKSEELIVYGVEIPVINILHESEDSFYEYELAEIYVKKFIDYVFANYQIEYEAPCEYMAFSGDDLDILFLNAKKKLNIDSYNMSNSNCELLCLKFLLKSEFKINKNINISLTTKIVNDMSKEIILIIAKSKYNIISNTINIKEDEQITMDYYIENNYMNLEIHNEISMCSSIDSITSLEAIINNEDNQKSHKINKKWLKFIKRKLKKKYQFIEKITLKQQFEELLDI